MLYARWMLCWLCSGSNSKAASGQARARREPAAPRGGSAPKSLGSSRPSRPRRTHAERAAVAPPEPRDPTASGYLTASLTGSPEMTMEAPGRAPNKARNRRDGRDREMRLTLPPSWPRPSVTKMFLESLEQGKFPADHKLATIVFIHKSGKLKNKCSSFRPISLLNAEVKILAKLLATRLSQNLCTPINRAPCQQGIPHSTFDICTG